MRSKLSMTVAAAAVSLTALLSACATGEPAAAPADDQGERTGSASTTEPAKPAAKAKKKPTKMRLPRVFTESGNIENAPEPVAGTPCDSTADACIDLSANRSWLVSNGKVTYGPVPITHGRPGWETPPGTFRVQWKDIDHKSSIFNDAPMPYSVFFNGGIAFHEGSLYVESHGCIHLSMAAAQTYYNSLAVGDVVQVVP